MKCPICEKGDLKRRGVSIDRLGVEAGTFEADVRPECGEQIFGPKEAAQIEEKITKKINNGY
jgi:hypothetical protein